MYSLSILSRHVSYDPAACRFSLAQNGETWQWCRAPYITLSDDTQIAFSEARCCHKAVDIGIEEGVRAEYLFASKSGPAFTAITDMMIEKRTGRVSFRIRFEGDAQLQIKEVRYPGPISLNAEEDKGYTVYPAGQGVLIPARHPHAIDGVGVGNMFSRSSLMPFFGQVRNGVGFCAIYATPHDAKHYLRHEAGGDTSVQPIFIPSLGTMRHQREMIYDFFEPCDYITIAKHYRNYVRNKGHLRTLDEKARLTPNVERLYGTVMLRRRAKTHVVKASKRYDHDDPSKNDSVVTFDEIGDDLKKLHARGLRNAQFCLDGWCAHGYDNRHPDAFPIAPDAGGEEGLVRLRETCESLGYRFEVHDQVRDYFYDSETFTLENAVCNPDGTHPFCDTWDGGAHTFLCAQLAPAYTRRNFRTFQEMGARLDGYYIDCLSISMLDECVSADHPMTREQCALKRRECFDELNAQGVVTSSEGAIDCIIESLHLGAAYHFPQEEPGSEQGRFSIPRVMTVPLFNLVYHDCFIGAWPSLTEPIENSLFVPPGDSHFLHAVLNGNAMWIDPGQWADEEFIEAMGEYQKVHKRIARLEMTHHESVNGNAQRQRTRFADGTTIEVDFDANTYDIKYPA